MLTLSAPGFITLHFEATECNCSASGKPACGGGRIQLRAQALGKQYDRDQPKRGVRDRPFAACDGIWRVRGPSGLILGREPSHSKLLFRPSSGLPTLSVVPGLTPWAVILLPLRGYDASRLKPDAFI